MLVPALFSMLLAAPPARAGDALIAAAPTGARDHDPLALVPALALPHLGPDVVLAERAIERKVGKAPDASAAPQAPGPQYTYVDVKGWKSPGAASGLSLAVPGAGQLYAGSRSGYVFLGVEAVAVAAYVKYRGDSRDKRDQYFGFVGDPSQSTSRFSFDRLASTVSPDELARLKAIYAKDPHEFYDIVTSSDSYDGGWSDANDDRAAAAAYRDDIQSLDRKSRVGLFVALTNHVVSTIDALRVARLNNVALTPNLSMKIKLRPGAHQSYGVTLTQKF